MPKCKCCRGPRGPRGPAGSQVSNAVVCQSQGPEHNWTGALSCPTGAGDIIPVFTGTNVALAVTSCTGPGGTTYSLAGRFDPEFLGLSPTGLNAGIWTVDIPLTTLYPFAPGINTVNFITGVISGASEFREAAGMAFETVCGIWSGSIYPSPLNPNTDARFELGFIVNSTVIPQGPANPPYVGPVDRLNDGPLQRINWTMSINYT